MRAIKELLKLVFLISIFIIALLTFFAINIASEYWITDHRIARNMCVFTICGIMTVMALVLNAKLSTVLLADVAILAVVNAVMTYAESFVLPIAMIIYLIPIYQCEKNRRAANES